MMILSRIGQIDPLFGASISSAMAEFDGCRLGWLYKWLLDPMECTALPESTGHNLALHGDSELGTILRNR